MDMDQDVFYKVAPFDREAVDLSKPAMTVEEYMQQVVVSRELVSEVSVATGLDLPKQTLQGVPILKDGSGNGKMICSRFTPPGGHKWNIAKVRFETNIWLRNVLIFRAIIFHCNDRCLNLKWPLRQNIVISNCLRR